VTFSTFTPSIGAIEGDNGAAGEMEFPKGQQFMLSPFRDAGEDRQVAVMVQQQMHFQGSFGLPVLRPVKHRRAQLDHWKLMGSVPRIKNIEF
jgi:hypothetical protein